MSHPSSPPTDDELVARFVAGTLIRDIDLEPDGDRPDSLRSRLVVLHNAGRIDFLSLAAGPTFDSLAGMNFFSFQHVFCDVVPHLEAPPAAMMTAIKRLVEKGGSDLAAGFPYQALLAWLRRDISRADAIIDAFRAGAGDDRQLLAVALEAKADPALTSSFLGFDDERQQAAASALGAIKPVDDKAAEDALDQLLPIAQAACFRHEPIHGDLLDVRDSPKCYTSGVGVGAENRPGSGRQPQRPHADGAPTRAMATKLTVRRSNREVRIGRGDGGRPCQ